MPGSATQTDQANKASDTLAELSTARPDQKAILTNITEEKSIKKTGNTHYSYQKTTAYDRKALQLLKEDPTLSVNQIGNKLVELGKAKSTRHIYDRLKKSDILRESFAAVEKYHLEHMTREIYPEAAKQWKSILKDKTAPNKDKIPLIKLAADKQFGETHRHITAPTINVANIERMQVVIGNDLAGALEGAQKDTT